MCFSFVFNMKMMLQIQAMSLVVDVRTRLINLRSEGCEPLSEDVKAFCLTHDIPIPNMSDSLSPYGQSRKNVEKQYYSRPLLSY
jgi:hypothetical protein